VNVVDLKQMPDAWARPLVLHFYDDTGSQRWRGKWSSPLNLFDVIDSIRQGSRYSYDGLLSSIKLNAQNRSYDCEPSAIDRTGLLEVASCDGF
jgi:hypothetical protein